METSYRFDLETGEPYAVIRITPEDLKVDRFTYATVFDEWYYGILYPSTLVYADKWARMPQLVSSRKDLIDLEGIVREMEEVIVDKRGEMSATYGDILSWAWSLKNIFFPVDDNDEFVYPSEVFDHARVRDQQDQRPRGGARDHALRDRRGKAR